MNQIAAREGPDTTSRDEILATAAQCFMERGYFSSSIDDVARRMGSTKGRIYHHYPSKADLFFAVYRRGMQLNRLAVAPHLESGEPAAVRLRAMAEGHCRSMVESRPFQRVVWEGVELHMRGATTPEQRETLAELVAIRSDYSGLFRSVMKEAVREGSLPGDRPLGVAEQLMFLTLNAPVFGLAPREGDGKAERERIIRQCVDFAMRGLGLKEIEREEKK